MINELKPLVIGDLEVKLPIIQGGMGVAVSTATLASAVANCGGAGTIASVGLGYTSEENETNFVTKSQSVIFTTQESQKAFYASTPEAF